MSTTPTNTNPTNSQAAGAATAPAATVATGPNTAQQAVTAVQGWGETAYNKTAGAVEGIWNGLKNSNLGPWQIAGMAAGGILAWIIGNAFGGGGLLGMVISGLLAFAMVPAGRSIFNSFDKSTSSPAQQQGVERNGPEQALHRGQGQPVQRQGAVLQGDPVTAEVFFGGVAAEARKAAQQMPPAPSAPNAPLPMRPPVPASRAYP